MFYILSDTEVALNDVLIACQESIDYYEDALNDIDDKKVASLFNNIISERKIFTKKLEDILLNLGTLPSAPDPDKETGELIIEKIAASLSPNDIAPLISHRLDTEQYLQSLIEAASKNDLQESHRQVIKNLATQVEDTIAKLASLVDD